MFDVQLYSTSIVGHFFITSLPLCLVNFLAWILQGKCPSSVLSTVRILPNLFIVATERWPRLVPSLRAPLISHTLKPRHSKTLKWRLDCIPNFKTISLPSIESFMISYLHERTSAHGGFHWMSAQIHVDHQWKSAKAKKCALVDHQLKCELTSCQLKLDTTISWIWPLLQISWRQTSVNLSWSWLSLS